MKHNSKLNRSRWLLLTLFTLLVGISPAWGETLTENFNGANLPDGWSIVGDLSRNSDRARSGNGVWTSSNSDNANYLVTEAVEGTLSFYARAYNKSKDAYVRVYKYDGSAIGSQLYATSNMYTSSTPSWSEYSTNLGDYKGQIAIALNYAAIDDVTYTEKEAEGPAFVVKDGSTKLSSPYAFNFGLTTAGATKTFTLTNPGTEATPIALSTTGNVGASIGEATSIAAGGEVTLTLTMPDANASGTVTVTPTGEGLSAFTFNVSGTVKDPGKMFEDFSSESLPDGWSKVDYSSDYKWTFTNEYAKVGYYECSLTTPNLTFSAGELFFFDARTNYSWGSGYVKVQTSTDGETFVDLQTFSAASDLEYNTWKNFSVTIPSADIKYIRFLAKYSDIDNVYGGKTSDGANFAINTDGSTQSLGVAATGGKLEKTFTINNSGNVDLVISVAKSGDAYAQKTLLFTNDKGWANVYLYAWNDGGALTPAFPGNKQDATGGTNEYSQPLYSLIIPKDATKIIVSNGNNGSGNQSQDITIDFNKTGLYLDGSYAGVFYGDGDIIVKAKKDDINGSAKFTVGLNSSTAGIKNGSVELTFDALNGGSPFTIPVTGTVLPAEMPVEEFTDGLPANWTNIGWTFSNGEATGKSSSAYLTTPKLSFSADDFIIIKAKRYDSSTSDYLTVQGSNDNGSTWTAYNKTLQNADGLTYPDYGTIVLNDIPTSVNKLRFTGYYCIVDEIHGLNYAPVLSVTTGDPAQTVTTPANYDFGETSANASVTYNFANAGAGTIDITNVAITGDGAAAYSTNWTESTATPFDLTISRAYDAERAGVAQDAVVTVTTSEGDFVINVTGTDMAAGANFAIDTDGTTPENLGLVTANDVAKKNFTITNSGNAPLVVTFTDDTDFYASTVSFTRPNDAGWGDNVYIYAWNSSGEPLLGAWPGKLVTESELNNMNERVYTARLPQNTYGIIFHDNTDDAHKTRDIKSGVGDDPEFKQIMGIYLDNKDVQKPTFWKNENLTIPAGESKTFTVRMASATTGEKSGNIALAFTASNATEFTIPVKGIVTATGSEVVDFNTAIPARWENQDNGWSIYNNEAAKCTGKKNLTTQKLDFSDEDNPFFVMKVKASDSGYGDYVTVEGSTDNGATWEAFDKKTYSYSSDFGANTGDYSTIVVSIPNTVNKLRFNGYYVLIDEIAGLKYSANDPTIAVKDAENADVVSGTTKDFGWAQTAQSATYKISNSGTGTLTISDITAPDGFTAATAGDVKTVAAGADPLVLTVTMTNAAIGAKSGTVTLTTDGGNFEIPVKGFIYGDRNLVDFTDASQYQGWTGVNVTDGVAAVSSTAIETTPFSAEAAEMLYVEIKGSSSYGSKSLSYSYSRDGGAWSKATDLVASTYDNVADQVFTISDIADAEAASTVKIRFTGSGLGINRIYGFTALSVPVMSIDKTADYNFGMQTEAAEYVITVTNNGTATLNNLTATLATGTDYSVAITKPDGESTTTITDGKATVPAGQQAIITVTQLFDANNGLASLSDVLTISGDDVESEEINLSGKTRDGSKWYVDFASGIPASFVEKGSWSYTSQQAYVYSESALVSQTLTIAANEKVQFDVKTMSYSTPSLKVRHSLDGGLTWSAYTDLTNEDGVNSSTYTTLNYGFGNTDASAVAMVEFLGANVYLDNIYGGALNNEAPMIQVKKGSSVVESGVAEAFGTILSETSAEYTIKNIGHGTLTITSPVTVTGDATATISETSLANNESATLTITMPVEAPYGEKAGVVTVKTSLGDFVINYTATTKNPNTLNVDFSDGQLPAGWYNDGWNVDYYEKNIQRSNSNSDTYFMTQKLQVTGNEDVLKFDAKKYGSKYASSTVLKVSYSTDRVNWTEIGDYASEMTTSFKTFEVSGLAAGEYYLKFTGRYAAIDNIIGWEKVAGIDHDLYVTATSFPAATTKGEDATISATVTSLRTAETGVYAKLFIDGEQEGEASATQDIALNGTKTFSFTYAIPEKKTAQIKVYYSDDTEAFATAVNTMKVNYALSETSSDAITTGTYDVTLTRSFQQGWNSICLPFAVEDIESVFGEDAKVYQFTSYTSSYVTFETVGEMSAGTPYLIKMPEASSEAIVLNDCNITTADAGNVEISGVTFQGTYAPKAAGTLTGMYGITTENDIRPATAEASLDGFRAYLIGSLAGARIMIFDETTGIKTVYGSKEILGDGRVYNLNGQHVENAKKGVYIVNGKKVVIK